MKKLKHATENSIEELGGKIGDEDKAGAEDAIKELKAALEGEDAAEIKAKTDALQQASMKIGEAMYRASQEEGAAESESASTESGKAEEGDDLSNDDDVLDADFTVDDEDKK